MTRRQSAFAYAALLLGAIAFASSFGRPTSGQTGAPNHPGEGRYRVAVGTSGNSGFVVVTDSVTGQTWFRYASGPGPWNDLGSPVPNR